MGPALDEAERALVCASWARAADAAASARRLARTPPERAAAECVWVQATYKLGALGASHEADARRAVGDGGEPFEPATLLLWSTLVLADDDEAPRGFEETPPSPADHRTPSSPVPPRASPSDRAAAAEKALRHIFREAETRRVRHRARLSDEDDAPAAARPGGSRASQTSAALVPDDVLTPAAWLLAVRCLCELGDDPEGAAEWLAGEWAAVPSPARDALADRVADERRKKQERNRTSSANGAGTESRGTMGTKGTTGTTGTESRGTGKPAGIPISGDASPTSPLDGRSDPAVSRVDAACAANAVANGASPSSERGPTGTVTYADRAFRPLVAAWNDVAGTALDADDFGTRVGAVAAAGVAVAVAYSVVVEAKRAVGKKGGVGRWLGDVGREIARWM
jgi:hypothetical protein